MTNFKDQFKLPNVVRICMYCGEEQHVDRPKLQHLVSLGWSPSHGYCQRHFTALLKQMGLSADKIKEKVESTSEPFCADLEDSNNKPMLNWLLNPTPHNKKEAA